MSQFWTGLLGGLFGSIATVVITKLLDIFQSSKQHKYELEKKFFEKKLTAAEAAMTQYQILSNSLTNLSLLYQRLTLESNDVDDSIQLHLEKQGTQQLELASNASFIISNSINLYFDIQSQFNQNNIIQNFYSLLGSLGPVIENLDSSYVHYKNNIGTTLEDSANKLSIQAEKEFEDKLKEIAQSVDQFNQELKEVMKQIREEMRKFDY